MNSSFSSRLAEIQASTQSLVCVGLDPDPQRIPPSLLANMPLPDAIVSFLEQIVDATAPYASAYKINFAFFEALGVDGYRALSSARSCIPADRIVIADAKRGDIGNTAQFYARSVFDDLDFDAITVSPYMGRDSVTPFLSYSGTAVYVLVRTSNPGAADLQLVKTSEGEPFFNRVARLSRDWALDTAGEVGFVTGATDIESLADLRRNHPGAPLLIPGVGAQGGDADDVLRALRSGSAPALINSSRAILYASSGEDFAAEAAEATKALRDRLRE